MSKAKSPQHTTAMIDQLALFPGLIPQLVVVGEKQCASCGGKRKVECATCR